MADDPAPVIVKTYVCLFINAKSSKGNLGFAPHQPNPISKVDVPKEIFFRDYFVCTFPKHFASIEIKKKSLKPAFALHFASNY